MQESTKKYTNGEVTILWQPSACIHSRICWTRATGLPEVFDPGQRPWIRPEGATTERIIEQVKKCPSGALHFFLNDETENAPDAHAESVVETVPNGPLLVYGSLVLRRSDGEEVRRESKVTAFCRCGQSANKPFCDGSHVKTGFEG